MIFQPVRFGYGANERTVTHVLGEQWYWSGAGSPSNYGVTFARQYLYDGARQRYLDRELDPSDWQGYLDEVLSETWSDYDGDSIYGDWTLDGTERMPLRSYEPGLATTDQLAGGGPENTMYLHTNALGSTMATSDQYGLGTFNTAYTAFGERIGGPFQRYGFAGAWGYQSHADFPYQHLGHRYYNPATGRFLQRDPIGLFGDFNVYEYAISRPTGGVDPSGLQASMSPPALAGAGFTADEIANILGCVALSEAARRRIGDPKDPTTYPRHPRERVPRKMPYESRPKPTPTPKPDGHPVWYPIPTVAFLIVMYVLGCFFWRRRPQDAVDARM